MTKLETVQGLRATAPQPPNPSTQEPQQQPLPMLPSQPQQSPQSEQQPRPSETPHSSGESSPLTTNSENSDSPQTRQSEQQSSGDSPSGQPQTSEPKSTPRSSRPEKLAKDWIQLSEKLEQAARALLAVAAERDQARAEIASLTSSLAECERLLAASADSLQADALLELRPGVLVRPSSIRDIVLDPPAPTQDAPPDTPQHMTCNGDERLIHYGSVTSVRALLVKIEAALAAK